MSRFNSRRLFAWLAWPAALAGLAGAALVVREMLKVDPFASYRPGARGPESRIAIVLPDVQMRAYRGPRLTASARVQKIEVSRNRQYMAITGFRGTLFPAPGKEYQLRAVSALWNPGSQLMQGGGQVRLASRDLKLSGDRFTYDGSRREIQVQGQITGRLENGDVRLVDLTYNLGDKSYITGPISWTGALAQDTPAQGRTRWSFKTQGGSSGKGDIQTFLKAEATDGEIIVQADKIERNVKTDVVVATGNVRYFGAKENMTCEKVTVYRREKRAVMEGSVVLLVKASSAPEKATPDELMPLKPAVPPEIAKSRPPAPQDEQQRKLDEELRSSESRRKYPTLVYCDRIEYWYRRGERRAVITGTPRARQDLADGRWREITTVRALYDGEKESLRLLSSEGKRETRMRNSIGDDVTANWLTVSTKEGDDSWQADGLQGDFYTDEGEVPTDQRGGKPPARTKANPPNMRGTIRGPR